MRVADPIAASWTANLDLRFKKRNEKTILAYARSDGPLVVQKSLYPEGEAVCHAIVVHPPGGIAGGDDLRIDVGVEEAGHALLTTPGAAKWYRSAGPWARQSIELDVRGALEWLPRETIVFDGARAALHTKMELGSGARCLAWEIVCLGRTGSGEKFDRGELRIETNVTREGRPLFLERGRIAGGGKILRSPAGLGGRTVFGTLWGAFEQLDSELLFTCRSETSESVAITLLPGLLVARYLGDSTEEAMNEFIRLWRILRPRVLGRPALAPRIWST